jgi:hypothetical protein
LWVKCTPLRRVSESIRIVRVHGDGWVVVWFQQLSGFVFENGFGENGGIVEMACSKVLGIFGENRHEVPQATVDGKSSSGYGKRMGNSSKEPYGQKCEFEKCFIKTNPA